MVKKVITLGNQDFEVSSIKRTADKISFEVEGKQFEFTYKASGPFIQLNEEFVRFAAAGKEKLHLSYCGQDRMVKFKSARATLGAKGGASGVAGGSHVSPMPGKIFKVLCRPGQEVRRGEPLIIVEAMKMEHPVLAQKDGEVAKVNVQEGQQIDTELELVELK